MDIKRISVGKLPFGELTVEGSFYPKVDGERVGDNGRCFFETETEARAAGIRYLIQEENIL